MNFIDSGEYVRLDRKVELPDFPLSTVILINGEPYDLIFCQGKAICGKVIGE
jgi:hypothetical protein